jgi:hypothetical protein
MRDLVIPGFSSHHLVATVEVSFSRQKGVSYILGGMVQLLDQAFLDIRITFEFFSFMGQ